LLLVLNKYEPVFRKAEYNFWKIYSKNLPKFRIFFKVEYYFEESGENKEDNTSACTKPIRIQSNFKGKHGNRNTSKFYEEINTNFHLALKRRQNNVRLIY
jgi:hypothetical protein